MKIINYGIFLLVPLMSACSDGIDKDVKVAIESIQNTIAPDSRYTYGQIYNGRDFCTNIKWEGDKTSTGKVEVRNICEVKLNPKVKENLKNIVINNNNITGMIEKFQKNANEEFDAHIDHLTRYLSREEPVPTEELLKHKAIVDSASWPWSNEYYHSKSVVEGQERYDRDAQEIENLKMLKKNSQLVIEKLKTEEAVVTEKNKEIAANLFNQDDVDIVISTGLDYINGNVSLERIFLTVGEKSKELTNMTDAMVFSIELVRPEASALRTGLLQWVGTHMGLINAHSYASPMRCSVNRLAYICGTEDDVRKFDDEYSSKLR